MIKSISLFCNEEKESAKRIVEINEFSYKILHGLASASERLVEGEKLAKSELNEQLAELARAGRDIIASKQNMYAAYNELLFRMGEEKQIFKPDSPPLILDAFPEAELEKSKWDVDLLIKTAQKNRGDYIAAKLSVKESGWRLKSAKNAVLPTLDSIVGLDLKNNRVGNRSRPFFSAVNNGPPEKDLSIMLNFSIPIYNNEAKGDRRKREAELSQAILEETKFDESIQTEITISLRNQLELIDEMYFANKAVAWFETTLSDELARLKEGYSSLFIVIDYEKRLRNTLIEKVLVQKDYAENLVQLLFLTGTLVKLDTCTNRVSIEIINYDHLLKELSEEYYE